MRTLRRSRLAALCAVPVVVALLLVTLIPAVRSRLAHANTAAVSAACTVSPWAVIPTPNTGTTGDNLVSVSGVSSSDVWSVGAVRDLTHHTATPIAEHWNGSAWKLVPTPPVGDSSGLNYLDGVAAVAANDVWAVGSFATASLGFVTLIEHWNGTSWNVVTSPNVAGTTDSLSAVTALSATNVWAVGASTPTTGATNTLIEHWNGTSWTIIPSPNPGTDPTASNFLYQLAGVSANDLWAVGQYETSGTGPFLTLAEHWNGTAWSVVSTPSVTSQNSVLSSVAGVASNDIWAVGASFPAKSSSSTTLIEHWNGSAWSIVASPSPGTSGYLFWVTAIAANDVVAVGRSIPDSLVEQWNGTTWSVVPSPDAGTTLNSLFAVTAFSPTDLWAVGESRSGSNPKQTLALHYRSVIKAGPVSGSARTASSTGAHILCQHAAASTAVSTGATANPRWQLMRFPRLPSASH